MSDMVTVTKDGHLRSGINLSAIAQSFMKMARANPGATLNMKQSSVCLEKGYAAAVELSGSAPIQRTKASKEEVMLLSPGQTLRLRHAVIDRSWTLSVTPSGRLITQATADAPEITTPIQAPSGAHPNVQLALNWLYDGEIGESSLALCQALVLNVNAINPQDLPRDLRHQRTNAPQDAGDMGRCQAFLARIPGLSDRLSEMSVISPEWATLVSADPAGQRPWDVLAAKAAAPKRPAP